MSKIESVRFNIIGETGLKVGSKISISCGGDAVDMEITEIFSSVEQVRIDERSVRHEIVAVNRKFKPY